MGGRVWERELWWYKLAHVCQRWRNLILRSASYLGLCLVCTYGTPIADMLAHSPPLPLVIDYAGENHQLAGKVEEGIILALEQRDRVRRVRLVVSLQTLQKLTMVMVEEYPVLEYLVMMSPENRSTALMFPEAFQAPQLRHLLLVDFALPLGIRLLPNVVGLVTLALLVSDPSAYFLPNILLQWLSFLPQLEALVISFVHPVPDDDVERQLMHMPSMTHATLPNLRSFVFRGVSAYMGAVAPWLTTPHLEKLEIEFFNQLAPLSVPCPLQFIKTTENLRFDSAKLEFDFSKGWVFVGMYLREKTETYAFSMNVYCWHLDEQISFLGHIFNSLSQIFSAVEHLTFERRIHILSSEEHIEVDRREWRRLLMSFNNVKTLRVNGGLVKEFSRCLRLDDGEDPLELLPKLQELTYWDPIWRGAYARDAFTSFVDARQNAGLPVTLMRSRHLKYGH